MCAFESDGDYDGVDDDGVDDVDVDDDDVDDDDVDDDGVDDDGVGDDDLNPLQVMPCCWRWLHREAHSIASRA